MTNTIDEIVNALKTEKILKVSKGSDCPNRDIFSYDMITIKTETKTIDLTLLRYWIKDNKKT